MQLEDHRWCLKAPQAVVGAGDEVLGFPWHFLAVDAEYIGSLLEAPT